MFNRIFNTFLPFRYTCLATSNITFIWTFWHPGCRNSANPFNAACVDVPACNEPQTTPSEVHVCDIAWPPAWTQFLRISSRAFQF